MDNAPIQPAPLPTPPPRPVAPPPPRPVPPPPPPPPPRRPIRDHSALNIAPLFLRILLGATFIWAGLGKVLVTFPVQGEEALALYNLGVIDAPASRPAESTPANPGINPQPAPSDQQQSNPPANPPAGGPNDKPGPISASPQRTAITLARFQPTGRAPKLASDFDRPTPVLELHRATLMLASASAPSVAADGTVVRPALLPAWMGTNPWAIVLAYAATIVQLLGGFFILLGLATRLWSLALVGFMGMAIWLTELGTPILTGNAVLGFLPAGGAPFDELAWMHLMWQFALLCVCLSLLFSGPGSLSLDRAIFRRRRRYEDDD